MRYLRSTVAAGAAVAVGLTLAACSSSSSTGGGSNPSSGGSSLPGAGKPTIIMGSKNFPEEDVLGQLYTQALEAKGYKVTLKSSIGATDVIDKALTSGQINMYPEYTGVIYTVLAGRTDAPSSAAATYKVAKAFEAKRGYTLLSPTPFQDADGLAVTKAYATKNGLKTIGDLSKVGSFSYTAPPENKSRYEGLVGLEKAYGLKNIKFIPLTAGSQYQALDQGKTDSIAIFTTDAQLASGKYVALTDTKGIFGYQQVAPVVKTSLLKQEGSAFTQTLNEVSKDLTQKTILGMNTAVQINKQNAADVAKTFLQANGLG